MPDQPQFKISDLIDRVTKLRAAQRDYLQHRGDEAKGQAVGVAAGDVDEVLDTLNFSRISIFEAIDDERFHQQVKWGNETDDTKNTPWMWAAYIGQYSTKWMVGTFLPLDRAVTDGFRAAMVKVATIAVAAIESIDRQRAANGKTFYEGDQTNA